MKTPTINSCVFFLVFLKDAFINLFSICVDFHFVENHRSLIDLINIFFVSFRSSYLWLLVLFSFRLLYESVIDSLFDFIAFDFILGLLCAV